jgi:hypothetical protein
MKVAIIYGSTEGSTASAAEKIKEHLEVLGDVTIASVSDGLAPAKDADLVVLGSSTWGTCPRPSGRPGGDAARWASSGDHGATPPGGGSGCLVSALRWTAHAAVRRRRK